MKAVDPTIRVGPGHMFGIPADATTRSEIDFAVMHPYMRTFGPGYIGIDEAPPLADFRPALMAHSRRDVRTEVEHYRNEIGEHVGLAWTEWNLGHCFLGVPPTSVYTTSLDAGLYAADMLRAAIVYRVSVASFFVLATFAGDPLREQGFGLFTMAASQSGPNVAIAQPAGLVFQMFSDFFGTDLLPTTVSGSPEYSSCWPTCETSWGFLDYSVGPYNYPVVEALGSIRSDGRVAVLLINKSLSETVDVEITPASQMQPQGSVTWAVLNSRDPDADPGLVTNSADDPSVIAITTSEVAFVTPLRLTLAAHTVNMVVLPQ